MRNPKEPMEHKIKIDCELFPFLLHGHKTCEFRRDDREYQRDDILVLQEWMPIEQKYSGREFRAKVTDIRAGGTYGIPDGYVLMSIIPEWDKLPMLRGMPTEKETNRWLIAIMRTVKTVRIHRDEMLGKYDGTETITPVQIDQNNEIELTYSFKK